MALMKALSRNTKKNILARNEQSMSILVAKKVLGHFLKVMQLSRSRLQHSFAHNDLSILSHLSKRQKWSSSRANMPKTQGPTNVSKSLKDLLDMSQKIFVPFSEIMKPLTYQN